MAELPACSAFVSFTLTSSFRFRPKVPKKLKTSSSESPIKRAPAPPAATLKSKVRTPSLEHREHVRIRSGVLHVKPRKKVFYLAKLNANDSIVFVFGEI
jgi:hypothetical protein